MTTPTEKWLLEAVIDQAAEWLVRNRSGEPLSRDDQIAFMAWLRASPMHVCGYLEVARQASVLPEALKGLDIEAIPAARDRAAPGNVVSFRMPAEGRIDHTTNSRSTESRLAHSWRNRLVGTVAAVLVLAFLVLVTGDAARNWSGEQVISAPAYKVRLVQLQDGSTVYLNAGADLRVRYSPRSRSVELIRGQALFRVVHDSDSPFRVQSGAAEVLDVGTQFDVDRGDGRTTVTVLQGKVDVLERPRTSPAPAGAPDLVPVVLRLNAGEQVQVGAAVTAPHVTTVDVERVTAWMHRDVRFKNRPLGEVIAEINRYAPVPVRIEDAALRQLRVNGVLDAYDTGSLLLFLQQYGEIEHTDEAINVRSRTSATQPEGLSTP